MAQSNSTTLNEPTICPGCQSAKPSPLEKIDLTEQHQKYAPAAHDTCRRLTEEAQKSAPSYQMQRCGECGLEFAWPMRSPNVSWYELAYQVLPLYPQSRWEFQTCLKTFTRGDKVFEFGCGSGVFLKLCREQNIEASGVDFSPSAVQECVQNGLNAFAFEINDPLPEKIGRNANQIVAFHVLEHLEQPLLLFEQAARVARPDAQLWIAVPSHQRTTRQRGFVDFLDQPPHHMTRWSRTALEKIGLKTGWRMTRFQTEPMPLGTALWWIVTSSPWFRRWREAGLLSNPMIERVVRYACYPLAMIRRMTVDRNLSGFAMLACYVRS